MRILTKNHSYDYFHENDISIVSLWNPLSRITVPKDKFKIEFLIKKNLYIWISPNHPLNQISAPITLEMLRQYPYCILRNTQNIDFSNEIYSEESDKNLIVDTKFQLQQLIREENYYTTDCFIANRFIYQDILSEKDFVIKKIEPAAFRYIIYRKETNYELINFIKEYTKNKNLT